MSVNQHTDQSRGSPLAMRTAPPGVALSILQPPSQRKRSTASPVKMSTKKYLASGAARASHEKQIATRAHRDPSEANPPRTPSHTRVANDRLHSLN